MENLELDVLQSIFDGNIQPRSVKLSAVQNITENFSKDRIIGEGGFATVYKVNFTFTSLPLGLFAVLPSQILWSLMCNQIFSQTIAIHVQTISNTVQV